MRQKTKKIIEISVVGLICFFIIALPLVAGTKSYPLTVIEGNSMYPYLQNGDLVYYTKIDASNIPNGTLIVFTQSNTGMSLLDGLINPVVIHRVIDQVIQADGTAYYRTKGDNNELADSALVKQDHVLGSASSSIPKVGLILLFLKSPQGLITVIGFIVIGYLSIYEFNRRQEKKKNAFIGAVAQRALNGEISNELFKKIESIVKYADNLEENGLTDHDSFALAEWVKKDGIEQKWKIQTVKCNQSPSNAIKITGDKDWSITLCEDYKAPKEISITNEIEQKITSDKFNVLLLEAIDETFDSIGVTFKENNYRHLEKEFTIKKEEIPLRIDDFTFALETLLGQAAKHVEELIIEYLDTKIKCNTDRETAERNLQDHIKLLKRTLELDNEKIRKEENNKYPIIQHTTKTNSDQ